MEKALEEGIRFAEDLTPREVLLDEFGHARALAMANGAELAARTILIAAGTQPNTVLAREDPAHFVLDGKYFRAVDDEGDRVTPERSAKPAEPSESAGTNSSAERPATFVTTAIRSIGDWMPWTASASLRSACWAVIVPESSSFALNPRARNVARASEPC